MCKCAGVQIAGLTPWKLGSGTVGLLQSFFVVQPPVLLRIVNNTCYQWHECCQKNGDYGYVAKDLVHLISFSVLR
jgi:hypothetical protein